MSHRSTSARNAAALLLIVVGCGSSDPTRPGDPPITGRWILPSTDTYDALVLEQHGSAISGTINSYFAPQTVVSSAPLTGTFTNPRITLSYRQQNLTVTFQGALSADGQLLTGTDSIEGRPVTSSISYRREMTNISLPH